MLREGGASSNIKAEITASPIVLDHPPSRTMTERVKAQMTDFSPREIVSELDRFIVGQSDAKRAVSIALRNRWRRLQLTGSLREEVLPKNILMIGPTGVGKTEIARRLAAATCGNFIRRASCTGASSSPNKSIHMIEPPYRTAPSMARNV